MNVCTEYGRWNIDVVLSNAEIDFSYLPQNINVLLEACSTTSHQVIFTIVGQTLEP